MGTLLWFLVIGGLFFLMMRGGCGAHVTGHGHGRSEEEGHGGSAPPTGAGRWAPPRTEVDPVCGVTVDTGSAKSAVYSGAVYYFCSAEHRDQFEADPGRYTGARPSSEAKAMEDTHG